MSEIRNVLVTGVTGYVGGRLAPFLLEEGYSVRVLTRDKQRIHGRSWLEAVSVVEGDALQPESLAPALEGMDAAFYLIHSMKAGSDFHRRDLRAARNFARAAKKTGVKRIIYLGGLGDSEEDLSEHLRSRHETGRALRESGVPVTEFRAGIIVGSGSVSFEMIRYLTERIPIMICPRWVYTRTQPIAVRDVLSYLSAALRQPESGGETIEVGGREVLTYGEMMLRYARARGLKRVLAPVPVLTPSLSSYWVHWVTPIPADIAKPLIQGLRNEIVVRDARAELLFPEIQPMSYENAVAEALQDLQAGRVETMWSDALATSLGDLPPVLLTTRQGMIIERRQRTIAAPPEAVYQNFASLGGARGWLYADWAWELRGMIDRLFGGVGLRRGRRGAARLRQGDALDFWRVEAVEAGERLRLRAEMKVPGEAWLEFEAKPGEPGKTILVQTAYFAPRGLSGVIYWYALYPAHALIFSGLINSLASGYENLAATRSAQPSE